MNSSNDYRGKLFFNPGSFLKRFFLSWLALLSIVVLNGFDVDRVRVDFVDEARNNRVISTEIYYPLPVTLSDDTEPFPFIVFGHGWLLNHNFYTELTNFLVLNGWIVAHPRTEEGLFPSHLDFGLDLAFLSNEIVAEGLRPESKLFGIVSSLSVAMGHSMGGGASILASAPSSNGSFSSVVSFAAAETTPSAIDKAADVTFPSLTISASNDVITPPDSHQLPIYESFASDYKSFVSIIGENHTGIVNNDLVFSLVLVWLRSLVTELEIATFEEFLENNQTELEYLIENNLTSIDKSVVKESTLQLSNYPNPFNNETTISFFLSEPASYNLSIFNIKGNLIEKKEGYARGKVNLFWKATHHPSGIYLYELNVEGNKQRNMGLLLK